MIIATVMATPIQFGLCRLAARPKTALCPGTCKCLLLLCDNCLPLTADDAKRRFIMRLDDYEYATANRLLVVVCMRVIDYRAGARNYCAHYRKECVKLKMTQLSSKNKTR